MLPFKQVSIDVQPNAQMFFTPYVSKLPILLGLNIINAIIYIRVLTHENKPYRTTKLQHLADVLVQWSLFFGKAYILT